MKANRIAKPKGDYQLHHIVCLNDKAALKSRAILEKFGIGVNSVANGVYVFNHHGRHTVDYSEGLLKRLQMEAKTREDVLDILNDYRDGILSGRILIYKEQ